MALSKEEILEAIAEMSVIDVVELIEAMEEKFGVSAAAPVAAAAAPAADGGGDANEEADDAPVDIHLTEVGDKKVDVIKAVRAITGLGLKDAKGLVDTAPSVIKEGVVKAEADEYAKQLEDAGAKAELK
jgi:large subunit ribosomal protein L7/L12|tara:strand:+ start:104 stop:490 length:387 start_codon:yes stop_codon:yes gene_type:complete